MGPFLSLGTRTPFATFAQLCLRGFKRVVHAAFRWYSWISPPRTSRRSIVPTVDRPIAGADLGRGGGVRGCNGRCRHGALARGGGGGGSAASRDTRRGLCGQSARRKRLLVVRGSVCGSPRCLHCGRPR